MGGFERDGDTKVGGDHRETRSRLHVVVIGLLTYHCGIALNTIVPRGKARARGAENVMSGVVRTRLAREGNDYLIALA